MTQYRPQEGERLDTIIFKAYGSLDADIIERVMEENKHLLERTVLVAGDVVFLPTFEQADTISATKALW